MNTQPARKFRIMLATDESLLALGANCLLSMSGDFEIARTPVGREEVPTALKEERPDVLVVDMNPGYTPELFAAAHAAAPACRIILWADSFSGEIAFQARQCGIAGVMRRSCSGEEFLQHVRAVARGFEAFEELSPERTTRVPLTRRESQVISLLAQGLRNKEIANCLGLSEGTVKSYLVSLFRKVGARDRFELAILGLKNTYWGQAFWDGPNHFVSAPEQERAQPILRSLVLVEPARHAVRPEVRKSAAGD